MSWTRFLFLSSAVIMASLSEDARAATVDCTGVSAYSASTIYAAGDQVTYDGTLYQAASAIWNVSPTYCTACGWWTSLGTCGSSSSCSSLPGTPTDLASSSVSSSSVNLTWTAPDAGTDCTLTGYVVYQDGTQVASLTGTSVSISGLTADTTYSFTVAAVNSYGTGSASSAISVTTSSSDSDDTTGNFPSRFAAPYVGTWASTSVADLASATGNLYYTLAFVISNGSCTATWNGDTAMSADFYLSDITALRALGGDVIVSFGGASGTELGNACSTVSELQAAYQSVITEYDLTWIDLDIEGSAVADTDSVDLRNKAIAALETANPNLKVSYTLPVMPTGLVSTGLALLENAVSNGTRVDVVNVMAMDYGTCDIDMGDAAVSAASATESQLSDIGLSAAVGVTPMIGTNDTSCEVFSTTNAQTLVTYAQENSFISLLAFWQMSLDTSYSYIDIFKTFN